MATKVIYIHGFNSGPGDKVTQLAQALPQCEIIAPQLPHDPAEAIVMLGNIIDDNLQHDLHIVGTSLGGFYTMYLTVIYEYYPNISFYLINPSLMPHTTLLTQVGRSMVNYKTGVAFILTRKHIASLQHMYENIVALYGAMSLIPTSIYLSTNDEVLDHTKVKSFVQSFKCPVRLYESDQDHRHSDISNVITHIKLNMVE